MEWFPKMPRLYGNPLWLPEACDSRGMISEWPPSAFPRLFGECCSLGQGSFAGCLVLPARHPSIKPSKEKWEPLFQQNPLILASVPPRGRGRLPPGRLLFCSHCCSLCARLCPLPGGDSDSRVGCEWAGETSQPPLTPTPTQGSRMQTG